MYVIVCVCTHIVAGTRMRESDVRLMRTRARLMRPGGYMRDFFIFFKKKVCLLSLKKALKPSNFLDFYNNFLLKKKVCLLSLKTAL